ncbi:MAG: DUF3794 domain-containing protein [Clostridiales bacterium]|nr:DUF3794 domain-containing protein [Clostridiales bacterium]
MDFVKTQIQMERKKGAVSAQASFDEAYNLPDYLPDIYSVILAGGEIRLDEVRPGSGQVAVKGAVLFRVLYKTDQNEWKISSLNGEIPFQETLSAPELGEFDMVSTEPVLEDLSVQIANSRKLNIRALIELKAVIRERYDIEAPTGTEPEVPSEVLTEEKEFLELRYCGRENCHIREEIRVPSNKPNIRQSLWQQAQVFGVNERISAGMIEIEGEIEAFLVYVSEEDDSLQWFTAKVPFRCEFEIPEADSAMIPSVGIRIQSLTCSVGSDEDGESRVIWADADLSADVRLYQERRQELIRDIYALDRRLVLKKEVVSVPVLRRKNESKCRVNDTVQIESRGSDILQICAGFGSAQTDRIRIAEDGIQTEGAVRIRILYLTDNDSAPLEAAEGVIPFQHLIEIPGIRPQDEVELRHSLETLSFLMKNGREAEVQAVVSLQALVSGTCELELICEIQEEDFKIEELNTQPSIVGLTLDEEDSLWEIAKKYHTTREQIRQMNQLENDHIRRGMKILLIKQLPQRA